MLSKLGNFVLEIYNIYSNDKITFLSIFISFCLCDRGIRAEYEFEQPPGVGFFVVILGREQRDGSSEVLCELIALFGGGEADSVCTVKLGSQKFNLSRNFL